MRRLHLGSHVDKLVATYSGGTRRKLSTALALVGKPDILLLVSSWNTHSCVDALNMGWKLFQLLELHQELQDLRH